MIEPVVGMPGIRTANRSTHRRVFRQVGFNEGLAGGKVIDGSKSRDPGNSTTPQYLRPGLPLGRITSSGKYASAIIGQSTVALTGTGTSLTVSAATATEIVRRIGSTGTFKLTGPAAAAGTVRTLTATYSAVNTTTGVVTITALGVNEVQTVNLVTAGTAGNLRLIVQKVDGTYALTPNIAWSATDATLLSNANTALDTATGVTGGIVATAIAATDTDLGMVLTYSGTGYAGNTWALAEVHTLFTSNTGANVVRTTTGVPGAFIAGSYVQPTDGSETLRTLIPDGWNVMVTDSDGTNRDVPMPNVPTSGIITPENVIDYPTDTSLITWFQAQLDAAGRGKFIFDTNY